MITPEQVSEAIKAKRHVYRLCVYSTSASRIESFIPTAVAYSVGGHDGWLVTSPNEGAVHPLDEIYLSKYDALVADADRLDRVAYECALIASRLRDAAAKERPTVTGA